MLGLISYSLIILALLIGVLRRPAVGMAAVLCLYGLKQWGQSSTQILEQYRQFTNFAVAAIALVGVALASRIRGCVFCKLPASAALLMVLFAYAFISVLWAPDSLGSLEQWMIQGPYILTIALIAPLLFNNLDDARTGLLWTALVGALICMLALVFGHWGNRGLIVFGSFVDEANPGSSETNPLALSSMAGTVFLIAAMSLGRTNSPLLRCAAAACIPIALAVILKSGSRGQFVASGAGLLVALPIAFRVKDARSFAALILGASLVLGLAYWGASLVEIDGSRWTDKQTSEDVAGRILNAQTVLNLSTSHFVSLLFGLGNSSSFQILGFYPHVAALEVLAEEGIIGSAIYCATILYSVRSIIRILGRRSLSDSELSGLSMLCGLFVFEFILSQKQGTLLSSVYVFAYAIILGRLEQPTPSPSPSPEQTPSLPGMPRFQNLLR